MSKSCGGDSAVGCMLWPAVSIVGHLLMHRTIGQKAAAPQQRAVSARAFNEVAMLANEAGFIAGTALTMVGITLVVSD